ncbi:MAG: Lrp/AsnC family transcriptional regulator [Acidobacteriota bacterium]|nr:Lrp/AsnC family transcriptional regulator [Acidobacteriota bacterium]
MNTEERRTKLDKIDLEILKILQSQGRITNAKLAQEVGLSAPPMLERVKKLERNGFIKSYRAILDANKLGCKFLVFVALNLDVAQLPRVEEFEAIVRDMPEVLECHHIAGDIDLMLKVGVADQETFKDFVIGRLSPINGINRIQSWVVLSTSKETSEIDLTHARIKR